MLCPNCSYNNSPNNRFCVRCGIDLTAPAPTGTPAPAAAAPTDPATPPGAAPAPPPPPPAAPNPWGVPPSTDTWSAPGTTPPPPPPPPPYGSSPYGAPPQGPPAYGAPPYGPPPGAPPTPAPNPFAPPSVYGAPSPYAAPAPGPYAQYPPPYPPSGFQTATTNGLAIAALVLGLVGWIACGVGSVIAVILGFVAQAQIRDSRGRQGGGGLARAGIILGFIGIGLVILFFVISIAAGNSNSN